MSGDDNGILVNNGTGSGSEEASMRSSSSTSSTPVKNDSQQPIVISRRVSRGSMSTPMTSNSLGSSLSLIQGGYNDVLYMRSVERSNISMLMKLVVKHLLETGMRKKRVVDSHEIPLVNFFVVLENLLNHGLRIKKNILGVSSHSSFWPVIEIIPSLRPEAIELNKSVKDLPNVRTSQGRARAWLRMAFIQKQLADYFTVLVDRKELLYEFYEEGAFMLSEETTAIGGLLIGLNVIECNEWCVKDDSLDHPLNVIDMKYYFKASQSFVEDAMEGEEVEPADLKEVLDQKHYLEEMNRSLMARIYGLKQRIAHLEIDKHDSSFEVLDSSQEVIVPSSPSNGFLKKSPSPSETPEEKLAKELDSVNHVKNEMEVAMKLLEKDIHEKQDTIVSIRRQLEDIKTINIQLFQKTKQFESEMKEKDNKIMKQDQKIASCLKNISQLESKMKSIEEKKNQLEEIKTQQEKQIEQINCETTTVEAELNRERERSRSLMKLKDDLEADLTKSSAELEEAKQNLKEYHRLRKEFLVLQKKCAEYELSLEEVGVCLKESILEVDGLKDSSGHLKEAVWMKDSDASDCFRCEKPFSVSRRKHHCRNCGRIFCASCSDNKMSLASSDKPVRVCDSCHTILLERCSAK